MKILIHDLAESEIKELYPEIGDDIIIVSEKSEIKKCVGCFGCWIKTPGSCVIRDGYETVGKAMGKADELIVISRICYGGYSPFVKNVLDRNISYIMPFFTIRNHEMHHKSRYKKQFKLSVIAYGDATPQEKETMQKLTRANDHNFNTLESSLVFADSVKDIGNLRRAL